MAKRIKIRYLVLITILLLVLVSCTQPAEIISESEVLPTEESPSTEYKELQTAEDTLKAIDEALESLE